jgi:hypothetical protein
MTPTKQVSRSQLVANQFRDLKSIPHTTRDHEVRKRFIYKNVAGIFEGLTGERWTAEDRIRFSPRKLAEDGPEGSATFLLRRAIEFGFKHQPIMELLCRYVKKISICCWLNRAPLQIVGTELQIYRHRLDLTDDEIAPICISACANQYILDASQAALDELKYLSPKGMASQSFPRDFMWVLLRHDESIAATIGQGTTENRVRAEDRFKLLENLVTSLRASFEGRLV